MADPTNAYSNSEQGRLTSTDHLEYLSQTSIEPQHLNLNLRILAFSEACRTVPLAYPSKKGSGLATIVAQPVSLPPSEEDEFMNLEQQTALLTRAQKLYALANVLQHPVDRNTYMRELENVGGLLAYKVPETSSIAKYLTLERREAVADQINRAILSKAFPFDWAVEFWNLSLTQRGRGKRRPHHLSLLRGIHMHFGLRLITLQ